MPHASREPAQHQSPGVGSNPSSTAGRIGYPFDRLASAFDRVRNARDWRAPIEAVIAEEDRSLVEQAITLFTDAPPTFVPAPRRPGHLLVRAQGYGINPAPEPVAQTRRTYSHALTRFALGRSPALTDVSYKGFRIVARPYQVHTSHRWNVDLEIRRNGRSRIFPGVRAAASESSARSECVALGRGIIDGEVPGWSVGDLHRHPSRRLLHSLMALLLFAGLTAFAVNRIDAMSLLETVGGWITSLMVFVGVAIVAHIAGNRR